MQDDKDSKKRRGPVSCAECRRLKLKCDRKVPCSSCLKRGCGAICPTGTLVAGPGSRFILADTKHLHEKIEVMSRRISELEDALATLQAQLSREKHPLLTDDLMVIKAPLPTQNFASAIKGAEDLTIERFGTLTLGENAHFFGQHASADFLAIPEDGSLETATTSSSLPLDILLLSEEFPVGNVRNARDMMATRLAAWLPAAPQAWELVELYYRDATWLFMPMSKEELTETIFARVYADVVPTVMGITPHELGVLFIIFAIACLADMNRSPYNAEAETYYQLARAALGLDSIMVHPTIQAVQALHLMSTYAQMCENEATPTAVYTMIGLASQMCKSLGLHRDDTQWKLPESEQQRRRHLFWEVASYDLWCSMAFGRPAGFTEGQTDAKLPTEDYKYLNSEAEQQAPYRRWQHTFVHNILFKVSEQAFGIGHLTYAKMLRLDRLVREHPVPDELVVVDVGAVQPGVPTWLLLQRISVYTLSQKMLLFLNRSFFARALMEQPEDPLKSMYAQSVLSVFRSAFSISASIRALYIQAPIMLRFWVFSSQCLTAALIFGSIVLKSPGCNLAAPAWGELSQLFAFMEEAAPVSRRISHVLPKVRRLRLAAQVAYTAHLSASSDGLANNAESELVMKEVGFLYGKTRLVDNAKCAPSSTAGSSAGPSPDTLELPPLSAAGSGSHPSTLQSSSANESASTLHGSDGEAAASLDDLFAALNQALLPANKQVPEQTQQLDLPWNLDMLGSSSAVDVPPDPITGLPSTLGPQLPSSNKPFDSWNFGLGDPMTPVPPLDVMPPSGLDIPWHCFMTGIGFDEYQFPRGPEQESSTDAGPSGP